MRAGRGGRGPGTRDKRERRGPGLLPLRARAGTLTFADEFMATLCMVVGSSSPLFSGSLRASRHLSIARPPRSPGLACFSLSFPQAGKEISSESSKRVLRELRSLIGANFAPLSLILVGWSGNECKKMISSTLFSRPSFPKLGSKVSDFLLV